MKKLFVLVLIFVLALSTVAFAEEVTDTVDETSEETVDATVDETVEDTDVEEEAPTQYLVTMEGLEYLVTVDADGLIVSVVLVDTEEPATEEPATEEPATEEPATEEPATEEPATEEPATEEPATEEPATEEPATEEPATEEPATEEPATEEPVEENPLDAFVGMTLEEGLDALADGSEYDVEEIEEVNEDNPNYQRFQNALMYNITNGKMNLLEKLSDDYDLEEWSTKTVKEIMAEVKMLRKQGEEEEEALEEEALNLKKAPSKTNKGKSKGRKK